MSEALPVSLRTEVCDLLGCEYPVVLAGMGGVARSELALQIIGAPETGTTLPPQMRNRANGRGLRDRISPRWRPSKSEVPGGASRNDPMSWATPSSSSNAVMALTNSACASGDSNRISGATIFRHTDVFDRVADQSRDWQSKASARSNRRAPLRWRRHAP